MRLALVVLLGFCGFALRSECAPPTCYSRALELSKEIMTLLDRVHTSPRTKTCAEVLPTIFIDVHNSCITNKLRDFLYVVLNHPRPGLQRETQDLVFFSDDCQRPLILGTAALANAEGQAADP
ncbi:Cytokine-like protein 1 [Oryzias melastigma]|uniref:Cytokine-like protein 1 n=1 Tax=Oryzias melastigma TaxID=30732 RepID=A0A834FEF2_ORYME|nr:Cytokine-like protein 1 [Oryzias melastigma]